MKKLKKKYTTEYKHLRSEKQTSQEKLWSKCFEDTARMIEKCSTNLVHHDLILLKGGTHLVIILEINGNKKLLGQNYSSFENHFTSKL